MKLSKAEIKLNFPLFAMCLQIAYTLKEHATAFVAKVREAEYTSVDQACEAIFNTARSIEQVSLLQILVGKANFWDNPGAPRQNIVLPEDLFRFPQKIAQMSYESVCGTAVVFRIMYVHSEELDLIKTFFTSNRRLTVSDFTLALVSFCCALPGVQVLRLGCHDPHIDQLVDLPISNSRLMQTLPTIVSRDEEALTRIANFFRVLDEHHILLSGLDRVMHAFRTRQMTPWTVTETERVFFALGRKLDSLKRIYATDLQNNVLIEATQCFLFAQQILLKAKTMPIVKDVDQSAHAVHIFGSMQDMQPVKAIRIPKMAIRIPMKTVLEDIDAPAPVPKVPAKKAKKCAKEAAAKAVKTKALNKTKRNMFSPDSIVTSMRTRKAPDRLTM